jgi:cyclophilin family peptidyl-prolyl cis-trans isomerase
MNRTSLLAALSLLALTTPLSAQTAAPAPPPAPAPAPGEIVAAAPASDWVAIESADLLIMDLAPDARGRARRVIIQLMPAPFSQGWVGNIRTLAAAHWWDGLSINRVQDNYVVQWGDADGEDTARARALPPGLRVMGEGEYVTEYDLDYVWGDGRQMNFWIGVAPRRTSFQRPTRQRPTSTAQFGDMFSEQYGFIASFPMARNAGARPPGRVRAVPPRLNAVHCYGMVGVGRNLSPDTGTGAELYTVIGHAPRHLDRNIALVGRVIEGIEHLSSLPRGTEALGFYATPEERTPITSVRIATDLPAAQQPRFEYLSTESETFARYAEARANRRDPFFNVPAGGADICNIPVPVRRVP